MPPEAEASWRAAHQLWAPVSSSRHRHPGGEAELFPWGLWDTHVKMGRSRAVHPGWQHRCRVLSAHQGAKRALEVSVTQQGC